jgi:hypothetical protein
MQLYSPRVSVNPSSQYMNMNSPNKTFLKKEITRNMSARNLNNKCLAFNI